MISLRFESRALNPDTFQILQFDGEEEISHLFRFELHLVSRDPDIDFRAVLESAAVLEITTQGKTRYIHGMLSEFEQGGEWHSGLNEYRAVLVPRLWMMTQSQQNQIFQNQTVTDIIESELGEFSDKGRHPLVQLGLNVADYEIYTIRDYYEREYVVQYKETDFNFISRLMEHEGIFYFFENDEEREKVVITDAMDVDEVTEQCTAEFNKDAAAALYDRSVVYRLSRSQKQIPATILMKDYNYRSPDLPMQAEGDVTLDGIEGIGFVTEFGAHFKEPEEGEALAAIRAEEYRCRQNIYSGESNIASFHSGGLYSLDQHFRVDYNRNYLLTRVVHHGKQDIESWGNVGGTTYRNEFSCIPAGIQYRPQRITPKPKMYGIMNGVIDSEQDLSRADLDEQGRYKVLMPFDISGAAPGRASRRIRMAQPYGGSNHGMSFPLVKGTEVIWTCIDGDIDRPIITGAVPNPLNPSVTSHKNSTSNVIRTTSGITMSFNDGNGSANRSASSTDGWAAQQQNQNVVSSGALKSSLLDESSTQLTRQQQYSSAMTINDGWKVGEDILEDDGNFQIKVPYASDDKLGYLRIGSNCADETITDVEFPADTGWVDYTDGDRLSVTQGMRKDIINGGNYDLVINQGGLMTADAATLYLDYFRPVGHDWRRTTAGYLSSDTYTWGDSEEFFGGFKFDGMAGLSTSAYIGGKLDFNAAVNVELKAAFDISLGYASSFTYVKGTDYTVTKEHKTEAQETIELYVEATKGDPNINMKKTFGAAAAIGTVVGGAAGIGGAMFSALSRQDALEDSGTELAMGAGIGAAAGVYAGAVAAAASAIKKQKNIKTSDRESQIVLGKDKTINLQAGNGNSGDKTCSNITMKEDEIELVVGKAGISIADGEIIIMAEKLTLITPKQNNVEITDAGIKLLKGDLELSKGSIKKVKDIKSKGKISAKQIDAPKGKVGGMDAK